MRMKNDLEDRRSENRRDSVKIKAKFKTSRYSSVVPGAGFELATSGLGLTRPLFSALQIMSLAPKPG